MKLRKAACILALAFSSLAAQSEELNVADLPASKPADTKPRLAYGQLLKYGDRLMFAPCRGRTFVFFDDVSADGLVSKALDTVGMAAGKKLYVELLGFIENDRLKASQLNFAQTDGRCQVPGTAEEAWRASGNEPGWILAAGGEQIQFKRQGRPEIVLPFAATVPENGVASYRVSEGGHSLTLSFEQRLCHDTLANSVFGWTAAVTVDGETVKGCAWQR
jgi:putative lipoprotein